MTMQDPLGDMLTRIRNGHMAKKAMVECPMSKLRAAVLEVLKKEGFIRGYSIKEDDNKKKYFDN
jgi:small subunit ribosomal protein S8